MRTLIACILFLGLLLPRGNAHAGPDLEDLLVSPSPIELRPGEEATLSVAGLYDDGSTADLTAEVVFESRDEEVVVVLGNTAVAVGGGNAEIRVEHPATGVRAGDPAEVSVSTIVALTIAPPSATIEVGEDVRLAALADLDDGTTDFDVSGVVDWESSRNDVASVAAGLVVALSVGETEISATDPSSGTNADVDASIMVEPAPDPDARLLEVIASPLASLALVGDVIALSVSGIYDDDTTRDITDEVTFESNRPHVASVDVQGNVYALAPGRATIRVDHPSGRSAGDRPEVWVGELQQIHLSPTDLQLTVGSVVPFAALATYDNGLGADVTEQVSWSSDQASVAAVSSVSGTRGRVTGLSVGSANVSALHGGTGLASPPSEGGVTVVAPTPTPGPSPTPTPVPTLEPTPGSQEVRDLVFDPPVVRLLPGETGTVAVTAVLRDGSSVDVTDRVAFRIRDRRIASIDAAGDLTALGEGHTLLSANDPASGRRARVPARVEVTRVLRLRVSPATAAVAVGGQQAFVALADFDDGSTDVDVTDRVVWSVVAEDGTASVDDSAEKGRATGLAHGRVRIRAVDPVSGMASDGSTGRLAVGNAGGETVASLLALRFDPEHLILAHRGHGVVAVSGLLSDGSIVPLATDGLDFRSLTRRTLRVRSSGETYGRRPGVGTVEIVDRTTGISGRLPVTVKAMRRLVIEPDVSVVEVGEIFDLSAFATYNDGTGLDEGTADLRWRSLDPSLVEMDPEVPGRGLARREGIAIVEASHRESRVRSDARSGVVHVVTGMVSLSVAPGAVVLAPAATRAFQAHALYSDGSVVDVSAEVEWSVTDASVASIDAAGVLTAHDTGDTHVVARHPTTGRISEGWDRGFVAVGRSLIGLQVSRSIALEDGPRQLFLHAGQTDRLYGLALLDAGGPVDRTSEVVWTSSNPGAVTVTQNGLVTCAGIGTARVSVEDPLVPLTSTATLGDATVYCDRATVDRLEVRPAESSVDYPASRNLRAFRIFTDGHEVEITSQVRWRSANPDALTVIETGVDGGRVTGLEDDQVTVIATDGSFGLVGSGVVTVRKVRVGLRIFEHVPESDGDGVFRGRPGDVIKLKARVEYLSGATRGVNQVVQWTSSNPSVLLMGDVAGLEKTNWGIMLGVGTTTITATWPADEFSPELTDSVEFEVLPP